MVEFGRADDHVCAKCQKPGDKACEECIMVMYCSEACKTAHSDEHVKSCQSDLMRAEWEPGWVSAGRTPFFDHEPGGTKFPWGNTPPLDIVRLSEHEGEQHPGDMKLLFAASGDLRNLIKSVVCLPPDYHGPLTIVVNDQEVDVVARNIIISLLALLVPDDRAAIECMLHIWFSAFVRECHVRLVKHHVYRLLEISFRKISTQPDDIAVGQTWTIGSHQVRAVLKKGEWVKLLARAGALPGPSVEDARKVRRGSTMAVSRNDLRDRKSDVKPPAHRVGAQEFIENGILLPFGNSRQPFCVPNPTMFQSVGWPISEGADPLDALDPHEICDFEYGPARHDVYAKAYYKVRDLCFSFRSRLKTVKCNFTMLNVEAQTLSTNRELFGMTFSRIECSNISDDGYLGITRTLHSLGPLLDHPGKNPHATMVTLFMSSINGLAPVVRNEEKLRALAILGSTDMPQQPTDRYWVKVLDAGLIVRDVDAHFAQYMPELKLLETASRQGMEIRDPQTIVDKWPLRLQAARPGTEFKTLFASRQTGQERYMEWKRQR